MVPDGSTLLTGQAQRSSTNPSPVSSKYPPFHVSAVRPGERRYSMQGAAGTGVPCSSRLLARADVGASAAAASTGSSRPARGQAPVRRRWVIAGMGGFSLRWSPAAWAPHDRKDRVWLFHADVAQARSADTWYRR